MLSALRQQKDRWIARLLLRYPSLFRAWEKRSGSLVFDDVPWQPLSKPIEQCKVALVTTGGVHLIHQPPFDMDNANGDHRFREIPADTPADQLKITHNYYDHRDADHDPNIVFPLERIQFLAQTGDIGSVNHRHFSFMGHILNEELDALLSVSAPEVARLLREDGVEVAILSPA